MRFARIENGRAVEIVETPDAEAIAAAYHPDLVFVPCGEADAGWSYDGAKFSPPSPDPDAVLKNVAAAVQGRIDEVRVIAMDYFAAGKPVPKSWVDYRAALIAIRDNPPKTGKGFKWPDVPSVWP